MRPFWLYMQGQDKMADDVAPSVKQYKFSYILSIDNILVNIVVKL